MAKFQGPPTRTPFLKQGASSHSSNQPAKQQTQFFDAIVNRFNASPHIVNAPETSTSPGTPSEMAISSDGNTLYVCVAPNSWRMVALTSIP